MSIKTKPLDHIVIEECNFCTKLSYNTNTNHTTIVTTHQYLKDKIKAWRENNKKYNKEYQEKIRDPNIYRQGSDEHRIKISCIHQGITRDEWDGFLTDQPYCSKFNASLRTKIRNDYNNCDYISGLPQKYFSRKLSVHHVNYDKECGCDGVKCKLIPLSASNHIKTNANRTFWNRLFIYALEIDKTYYENEPINIFNID